MHPSDSISRYRVPDAPRPTLAFSRRGEGRARSLAGQLRRRVLGRRLAYVDSHFPWQRSGLRYADALALHEARPDTVFFSLYEMRDPFPAPVLPLAQFPRLAPSLGITDLYGVSPRFMAGALGLRDGLDLSGVLQREGIRTHVGLYPGDGFVATEARRLVEAADQAFSWMPAALERLSGVTPIDPGVIDTAFYARTERDFAARPLELLLVADAEAHCGPRRGARRHGGAGGRAAPPARRRARRARALRPDDVPRLARPRGTAGAAPPLPRLPQPGDRRRLPDRARGRGCRLRPAAPHLQPGVRPSPSPARRGPHRAAGHGRRVRRRRARGARRPGRGGRGGRVRRAAGARAVRRAGRRRCPPRAHGLQPGAHAVRAPRPAPRPPTSVRSRRRSRSSAASTGAWPSRCRRRSATSSPSASR